MANEQIERKAISLVKAFEREGKAVGRVTIEGRRIELVLNAKPELDEFDRIDMRHDKA